MQEDFTMKKMDIYTNNMLSKQDGRETTHHYDISFLIMIQFLLSDSFVTRWA